MSAQADAARWFAASRRSVMPIEECAAREKWLADRANRAAITEMESLWSAPDGAPRQNPGVTLAAQPSYQAGRKFAIALLCAISLAMGALSCAGSTLFWTSLDWINR